MAVSTFLSEFEIDQHDPKGTTESYGMTIPPLHYTGPALRPTSKRYAASHRSGGTARPRTARPTTAESGAAPSLADAPPVPHHATVPAQA